MHMKTSTDIEIDCSSQIAVHLNQLPTMATFESRYLQIVHELWRRQDRTPVIEMFAKNAEAFRFRSAKSLVSFGPGNGVYDARIIENCMPNLDSYFGVDPGEYVHDVSKRLKDVRPALQVATFQETAETWAAKGGPKRSVDVVFCMEVAAHIPDIRGFLGQCWEWLAPGGALVVQTWNEKNLMTDVHSAVLAAEEKNYFQNEIRADLELLNLPIQEFQADTLVDLKDMTREFVTYLCWKNASEEELQKATEWLRKKEQELENGIYHYNTVVFVMVKS